MPGGLWERRIQSKLKKWIRLQDASGPITQPNPQYPHGQYDKADSDKVFAWKGFKGNRNYDVTDPRNPILLQEFSTGQTGNGTHDNFYDGGNTPISIAVGTISCGWRVPGDQ